MRIVDERVHAELRRADHAEQTSIGSVTTNSMRSTRLSGPDDLKLAAARPRCRRPRSRRLRLPAKRTCTGTLRDGAPLEIEAHLRREWRAPGGCRAAARTSPSPMVKVRSPGPHPRHIEHHRGCRLVAPRRAAARTGRAVPGTPTRRRPELISRSSGRFLYSSGTETKVESSGSLATTDPEQHGDRQREQLPAEVVEEQAAARRGRGGAFTGVSPCRWFRPWPWGCRRAPPRPRRGPGRCGAEVAR